MRLSRHLVALLCSIILPTCLPYILSPSHSLSRPLSISLQSTPVSSALTVISSALTKSLPPVPPSIHQHVVTSTLTVSYTQPLRPALPTATIHFFPGYLVSAWPIFFTDYLSKLATQTNSIIVTYHTSNFGLNHTSITAEITTVLTDAADITSRLKYLQHFYSSRDDVHVQTSPDIDPPKDVPYIVPHGQYHPVPTAATKPPAVHYIGHSLGCKILTLLLTKPHAVPTSVSYLSPNNADLLTSQITLISKLVARLNTNINLTLLTTLLTTLSGTISFQFQPPPNSVYDMLPGLFGRNGRYRDRTMFAVCDKNDEAGLDMALEFIEAVGGEGEVKGGIEGRGEEQVSGSRAQEARGRRAKNELRARSRRKCSDSKRARRTERPAQKAVYALA